MTTAQIPASIRASIHQEAINRVPEFFNATNSDIMNELLQNARRSGATRVEITTGDDRVTIADNGHGIRNPESILAFGKTEWEEQTARLEHPAGMGLYSLARCEHVSITSKTADSPTWRVDLTPEHFVGKLEAPVEPAPENTLTTGGAGTTGTNVTFSCRNNAERSITEAAKYYPLPVSINGQEAVREDFLQGAMHTQVWQGVRIGVYPGPQRGMLNFHGVVIREPNLPNVETVKGTWSTQADVRDCPQLALTLPARREVVETPFMGELRRACRAATYRAMLLHKEPVNVPWSVKQDAASMGILLPDAAPELEEWEAQTANKDQHVWGRGTRNRCGVAADSIVMELELEPPDQQALERAAERNGLMDRLFKPDPRLRGYGWYDRMTRATEMRIAVTDQDGEHDLEEVREKREKLENARPERIEFRITCDDDSEISLDADLVFHEEEEGRGEDLNPLVTRDSGISVQELTELMMDSFFWPSDDVEADSADTQEEECRMAYEKEATALLSTREEATIAAIRSAVRRHLTYEVPHGMTATIRIKNGEPIQVTLEGETPLPQG